MVSILNLFILQYGQSANRAFILSGGGTEDTCARSYRHGSSQAYVALKRSSYEVYVAATNGSWGMDYKDGFVPQDRIFPATSKESVEAGLRVALEGILPDEQVMIFITGHGEEPKLNDENWNIKIVLYRDKSEPYLKPVPTLSHEELMGLIKQYIPVSNSVKIVGTYCFAGGLHHISFFSPNVCSATQTDFLSVLRTHNSKFGDTNDYNSFFGFWGQFYEPEVSLWSAHESGLSFDGGRNNARGTTSSMAYVNACLQEGAYNVQDRNPYAAELSHEEHEKFLSELNFKLEGLSQFMSSTPEEHSMVNAVDLEDFEWVDHSIQKRNRTIIDILELINPIYLKMKSDVSKKLLTYESDLKKEKEKMLTQNTAVSWTSWLGRIFYSQIPPINKNLSKYRHIQEQVERLRRIHDFVKIASDEQLYKFKKLLECEFQPLKGKIVL